MNRREFLGVSAAIAGPRLRGAERFDLIAIERPRVLSQAERYLSAQPVTITASSSPRSPGGKHDFFSEADYFWPDPKNPDGPYVNRDGESNPANFVGHRRAMVRLSLIVPALAAAYKLTREPKYVQHAARHLHAWFIDEATRMNPNLQFAQGVHGVTTGRSYGIIDTLHLVEVARAAGQLDLSPDDRKGVADWFGAYLEWMRTSKNGMTERDAKNNHGTCWAVQAAAFAGLTGDRETIDWCRAHYKTVLIPDQEGADGSFPLELARTKPYGYSIFNLDVMSILVQALSTSQDDLWHWQLPDGRGIARAVAWMYPYLEDKRKWIKPPDVMYFDQWPIRQPSLLFAGLALGRPEYLALWKRLRDDPTEEEVIRNWPVRQPVLWV
jgi:hypothetical protein